MHSATSLGHWSAESAVKCTAVLCRGAKLTNADLESVDFENADLSDAVLEGAQVCALVNYSCHLQAFV